MTGQYCLHKDAMMSIRCIDFQVEDQDWVRGNLNLKIAFERGTPVRVCRGAGV